MTPHRCPVCNGKGIVPSGFYNEPYRRWDLTYDGGETCRSCGGSGVIWEPTPVIVPSVWCEISSPPSYTITTTPHNGDMIVIDASDSVVK